MGEVVQLPERFEWIWRCDCGNCSFMITSDSRAQCVDCLEYVVGPVVDVLPQFRTRRVTGD